MRHITRMVLAAPVQADLNEKQTLADRKRAEGTLQITIEWKNARQTLTLRAVLTTLRGMTGERERCMYCLDSHGTDIEHFWPKTPYPERMFRWPNLLLCCTECGRLKGNRFPLAEGQPLLIDPTEEEPWLHVDFDPDTGNVVARFDSHNDDWSPKASIPSAFYSWTAAKRWRPDTVQPTAAYLTCLRECSTMECLPLTIWWLRCNTPTITLCWDGVSSGPAKHCRRSGNCASSIPSIGPLSWQLFKPSERQHNRPHEEQPQTRTHLIGKENRPRLEPRILLEDPALSHHAEHRVSEHDLFDNHLIFGDNLLALKALEQEFAGQVKCVCIDPPYNTGSAFEHYDDGIEHSIWLSLIRDRLELLKNLLTTDGSLWISIDDNEAHYLKILCDEVFGRAHFVATIIWEKRKSRENRRVFSFNHDYVLIFAKDKSAFEAARNPVDLSEDVLSRYRNPDNDPRGPWQSVSANAQAGHATPSQFYKLGLPSGRELDPPKGRCWLYTKERMEEEIAVGNVWFGPDGDNVPRIKRFLSETSDRGLTPETIWPADEVGTNDEAKKGLIELLRDATVFDSPKPESLLRRIIHIATNPGDLVLDSFGGSGTTGAVAHKMGRRWIMVELLEHCHTHIIPRLKKVIDGTDQGGISKAVGWKGGGGFRYFRLAPSLLERDQWGNWVISKQYNPAMLAEAMCKHEGFTYAPSDTVYWQHGHSTERDFIYVTTQTLNRQQLLQLSEEVGEERALLICCGAFRVKPDAFPNLTLKKIPNAVLHRCEFGKDDYSLEVSNLRPPPPPPQGQLPFDLPAKHAKGREKGME